METIKRELTEIERKIIELQHHYFLKKTQESYGWKRMLIKLAILGSLVLLHLRYGPDWMLGTMIVGILFALGWQLRTFIAERKESRKKQQTTQHLLADNALTIVECKPQRALFFPSYDDEGHFYFFEVAENKLLCYHQDFELLDSLVPNSHFSFYADEAVKEVLGLGIQMLGERIAPIVVMGGIKLVIYDEVSFPAHLDIIEGSIEDFLDQAKARILKAGTA